MKEQRTKLKQEEFCHVFNILTCIMCSLMKNCCFYAYSAVLLLLNNTGKDYRREQRVAHSVRSTRTLLTGSELSERCAPAAVGAGGQLCTSPTNIWSES